MKCDIFFAIKRKEELRIFLDPGPLKKKRCKYFLDEGFVLRRFSNFS